MSAPHVPSPARKPNRLIHETSPYLLQHAYNPVDWYPWGPEALELAKREDKPIFLSVGYSACHWCHVMERECFENEAIAARMNALYVNIKVDREERPDVDDIYMKAVTALTGQGGWPMSVFLTPERKPFFGATYLPPVRAYGRPSFPDVLEGLADAYKTQHEQVQEQALQLTAAITGEAQVDMRAALNVAALDRSLATLQKRYDASWGGFGAAPKFPHAGDLRIMLRHAQRKRDPAALAMVTHTLDRMADGGMYDQLGGGFHRYSTDVQWRVPHFEKMLYDNAQLIPAYLEAFCLTGRQRYAQVARACCDWAIAEMQTPEGGFASAQDADSEGEEGRFFVWTKPQLQELLGSEAELVAAYFDVTDEGNFEHGKSVLWMPKPRAEVARQLGISLEVLEARVAAAKPKLLAARAQRVRPGTDDKVLASWNGLLISALACAHQVLDEPRYLAAAQAAMRFVLDAMQAPDGGIYATARAGRAHITAGLDDYAFLTQALLDLFESTFDVSYLQRALSFAELIEARFADTQLGGYFTTTETDASLIARLKSVHDGALPSGAAMHALSLLRLSELTGRSELRDKAGAALSALGAFTERYPQAVSHLLLALDFQLASAREVVIAGEPLAADTQALLGVVRRSPRLQRIVVLAHAGSDVTLLPLLADKHAAAGKARAYVCEAFSCLAPTESPDELARQLSVPIAD